MTATNMIDSYETANYFTNYTSSTMKQEKVMQCFDEQQLDQTSTTSLKPKSSSSKKQKTTTMEGDMTTPKPARKRRASKSSPRCSGRQVCCSNCQAEKTPLWRKGADGNTLCNKCGLYWSRHGKHRPVKLDRSSPKRSHSSKKTTISGSSSSDSDYSSPSSPVSPTPKRTKSASLLTKRAHSPTTPTKSSKRVKRSLDKEMIDEHSPVSQVHDSDDSNSFFFNASLSSSDEEEQFLQISDFCLTDEKNVMMPDHSFSAFAFPSDNTYYQYLNQPLMQQPQQQLQPQPCQIMNHQQQHLIDQVQAFSSPSVGLCTSSQLEVFDLNASSTNQHENDVFLSLFDNSSDHDFYPTLESGTVDDVVDMVEGRSLLTESAGTSNDQQGTFLSF